MGSINTLSILKFLELALSVACMGLLYKNGFSQDLNNDFISAGTFVGFTIILGARITSHILASGLTRKTEVFYSIVGCALFIAAGALNIKHYEDNWKGEKRDYGLAMASLAIINGAIFLLDSLLSWRGDY